jgi:hypothetical protein
MIITAQCDDNTGNDNTNILIIITRQYDNIVAIKNRTIIIIMSNIVKFSLSLCSVIVLPYFQAFRITEQHIQK